MKWNWQQEDWANFNYDEATAAKLESKFLLNSGKWLGVLAHLIKDDQDRLEITVLSDEALETSSIEGEILDRDSVQSSIQKQLGIKGDNRRVQPAEHGIAELMVDVYRSFTEPLSHERLYAWHTMLMNGRTDLRDIGRYRTAPEPMQIVSGAIHAPKVHYEAPPSAQVNQEMTNFVEWFNATRETLPATVRASLAHLRFESIHPFEDGNGRVGRAIAEYAVSQSLGQPVLLSLSKAISKKKKRYYDELASASKTLEITNWVNYFSQTIIEAQEMSFLMVDFIIEKNRLMNRLQGQINERQEKVLLRMFAEGIDGFKGGLSSSNYQRITKASAATATRDLVDLVEKSALIKTGKQRNTRYWLPSNADSNVNNG